MESYKHQQFKTQSVKRTISNMHLNVMQAVKEAWNTSSSF